MNEIYNLLELFLLDVNKTLWLPTPKDLLAVKTKPVNDEEIEDDLDNKIDKWEKTLRFQPSTGNNPSGKHLCFDSQQLPPMVTPPLEKNEYICRPQTWITATALIQYLKGDVLNNPEAFHEDPWSVQILPHIQMKSETRQVRDQEGYFTEVAMRLHSGWRLVALMSAKLQQTVVRLGGEGHRVLVSPLEKFEQWQELTAYEQPNADSNFAYLLTPGLAEKTTAVYGVYPSTWQENLLGCVSDRPLLWGGVSSIKRRNQNQEEFALLPQRAFVPPGTVYVFNKVPAQIDWLLPNSGGNWLTTFQQLNYGKLLWGQR